MLTMILFCVKETMALMILNAEVFFNIR